MPKNLFNIMPSAISISSGILFCLIFALILPLSALASANLSLIPASGSHIKGIDFPMSVTVDSGGASINAVQADLTFNNAILAVSSIDTSSSIFTTWTEYPSFSNSSGTIHFSGGIPHGFIGTGSVMTINFIGIAVGTGDVSFVSGERVLLNDGHGTNDFGTAAGGSYDILPVPLAVSCSASPSSPAINQQVTFTATASGGTGPYVYAWTTGDCTGSSLSTCKDSYGTTGLKTATVTVTSGAEIVSKDCPVTVGLPGLNASCSASPSSTTINNPVTFSATASGGTGSYSYLWTGACTGSGSTCQDYYGTIGQKTATVKITSGGLSSSSSCSSNVSLPGLEVHCSSGAQTVGIHESVTYTATVIGGNGSYSYSWSNQCTGNDSDCTAEYGSSGLKIATITVTSAGQSGSADCAVAVNAVCLTAGQHNICSSDDKCISISGAGEDQCKTDADCEKNITPGTVVNIITQIVEVPTVVTKLVAKIVPKAVKEAVNTPAGSATTKTVSTVGVAVVTAVAASSFFPLSLFELFLLPLRLFGLLMLALGLKKRSLPWGVIYDSVTKQPLDPAYVVLKNVQGKEISSAITDLDGRFGFLAEPGVYQMQVRKTNYNFPSQKLAGKLGDELYRDLYFGENIIIKTSGEIIVKNIPLDPIKFDWNEFVKKDKNLMKFYSKWDRILSKIYDFFFIIGFITAILAYSFAPYPYNTIIIILYVLFLLLRIIEPRPKTYGYIVDKMTGIPLSFPIIRVLTSDSNKEILSKSADRYGKYYCLVPPGKYYVKIEKKNDDGSYSLVYTSPAINVLKKGIIKQKFEV